MEEVQGAVVDAIRAAANLVASVLDRLLGHAPRDCDPSARGHERRAGRRVRASDSRGVSGAGDRYDRGRHAGATNCRTEGEPGPRPLRDPPGIAHLGRRLGASLVRRLLTAGHHRGRDSRVGAIRSVSDCPVVGGSRVGAGVVRARGPRYRDWVRSTRRAARRHVLESRDDGRAVPRNPPARDPARVDQAASCGSPLYVRDKRAGARTGGGPQRDAAVEPGSAGCIRGAILLGRQWAAVAQRGLGLAMPQATLKAYDSVTRTGKLVSDDGEIEYSVDAEAMESGMFRFLRPGQRVTFDLVDDEGEQKLRNL